MGNKLNLMFFSMLSIVILGVVGADLYLGDMGNVLVAVCLAIWCLGAVVMYLFDWEGTDFDFFLDIMYLIIPLIIIANGTILFFDIIFSIILVLCIFNLIYEVRKDERLTTFST